MFWSFTGRVLALLLACGALLPFVAAAQTQRVESDAPGGVLVYHQITNLGEGSVGVGSPMLSGDGTTAVFADAPGSGDPANPNRIFVVDVDGGEPTEVDAYVTRCYCGSIVGISDDGQTTISSDAVQVRIADGAGARELVVLTSNEITAIRITGDGETVFFLVRRDVATLDGTAVLSRGVWAIDADGDNLRPVLTAAEVAEVVGVPIEQTGCCFHADGGPLDVSTDGERIVVGAYAGTGEHVIVADGDGGNPRVLLGPATWVKGVSISGDGATVAYDVVLPDRHGGDNEVGVIDAGGGEPRPLLVRTASGFREPLSLSGDGAALLIAPDGLLIDVASGTPRQLTAATPGGDSHRDVLNGALPRATMDATASRVLYAMRTIRCADCANPYEQLAIVEIDPDDLGEAPRIGEAQVTPEEIPLNHGGIATASVEIEAEGTLLAAGLVALRGGRLDANVAYGAVLRDDGQNGDARAGDGRFTCALIEHAPYVTREDDTGPRLIRVQVEVESADGLRHATALDATILTVIPAP